MERSEPDVDVLVVGAGITGIYQLYRAREAGFSVQLLEAGGGVGGTWFWNRYPGARFDSESYTYGYLFSKELFDDWEWQEHFAGQPEIERYLNHVVDRFDLRRDIRFDAPVTSAVWDEASATWVVTAGDGSEIRARFLIAATGVLSVPYTPDVPGREDFRGEQHHTGLWPAEPVDFAGKRVAVIGTSSSGVQVVPTILDDVESVTVYQRTANWCTPLNNRPITPEEQAQLRAGFEDLREIVNTSLSGFAHPVNERAAFDDSEAERRAFFEEMWNSPGFMKLTSNYSDLLFNEAANDEWCEFIAEKIRGIVARPRDGRAADPQGSSVRREATSVRQRLLRGVQRPEGVARRSPGDAHRAADRNRDRDHRRCARLRHHRVGDRLRLRYRRAQPHGDPRSGRSRAHRALGGRPFHLPRPPDPWVPELLLPRWTRTPRPATTRATTATWSTSSPTRSSTRPNTATTSSR